MVTDQFKLKFPVNYNQAQLKTRYKQVSINQHRFQSIYRHQLRSAYMIFQRLKENSGWGWDHVRNIPIAEDGVWNDYVEVRLSQIDLSRFVNCFLTYVFYLCSDPSQG